MRRYDDIDELERELVQRSQKKVKKVKRTKFRSRGGDADFIASAMFDHPRPRNVDDLMSRDYLRRG